jgi:hypothetical protein
MHLTGERLDNGEFSIRKLQIKDKHGLWHVAYNAKVNIYRDQAPPILLGIEDTKLAVEPNSGLHNLSEDGVT